MNVRRLQLLLSPSALRSGKFAFDSSVTSPATIVYSTPASESYRILNSGSKPFEVISNGKSVEVQPKGSVDVMVTGGSTPAVQIAFTAAGPKDRFVGTFERLSCSAGVSGGRFNVTGTPAAGFAIVSGQPGQLYRILNSGDNAFTVKAKDDTKVDPRQSVDVVCPDSLEIVPQAANDDVTGIYERLTDAEAGRNGRFVRTQATNTPQVIIDLTGAGGGATAWYRIHNTGENPVKIVDGRLPSSPVLHDIGVKQSLEIKVADGEVISVKSAQASARIQGTYALLNLRR